MAPWLEQGFPSVRKVSDDAFPGPGTAFAVLQLAEDPCIGSSTNVLTISSRLVCELQGDRMVCDHQAGIAASSTTHMETSP
jgi:hypothetical protein